MINIIIFLILFFLTIVTCIRVSKKTERKRILNVINRHFYKQGKFIYSSSTHRLVFFIEKDIKNTKSNSLKEAEEEWKSVSKRIRKIDR